MKLPFSWSLAVPPRIWRAPATPTRPVPKPSRKPRFQSASARYICNPRPGTIGRGQPDAAPPSSAVVGFACDHLPDRGLAVGSPRADRGVVRGADSAAPLHAGAGRAGRYAVAGDDLDRVHRAGDSAVSAKTGRALVARP